MAYGGKIDGCEGKATFPDYRTAKRSAKRINKNHHARVGPYKCNHCGQIHIGRIKRKGPNS
jgi:hypothetical protein